MPPIRAAHFISSFWFEILLVIHLTMAKADLDHPALEKVPFYEVRLIHRKDYKISVKLSEKDMDLSLIHILWRR